MDYIHQSDIKTHGRLKDSNCVIDSRWMGKITDFGPHKLRPVITELKRIIFFIDSINQF